MNSYICNISNYGKQYKVFSTSLTGVSLENNNINLSPNTVIISSPENTQSPDKCDLKTPALFVTDSTGKIEQLTYSLSPEDFTFNGNVAKLKSSPDIKVNKLQNLVNALIRLPDISREFNISYSLTNLAYIGISNTLSYYDKKGGIISLAGQFNVNVNPALLPLSITYNNYQIKATEMGYYESNKYSLQDIPLYYYPNIGAMSNSTRVVHIVNLEDTVQNKTFNLNAVTETKPENYFSNSTTLYLYMENNDTKNNCHLGTPLDCGKLINFETCSYSTILPLFALSTGYDGLFTVPGESSFIGDRLLNYMKDNNVAPSSWSTIDYSKINFYLATNAEYRVLKDCNVDQKPAYFVGVSGSTWTSYYIGNVGVVKYSYFTSLTLSNSNLYYKIDLPYSPSVWYEKTYFIPNTYLMRLE